MRKDFKKLKEALEWRLIGAEHHTALEAFEFVKGYSIGLRKDGVTPELQHQVEICHYILTLKGVQDLESVLSAALLHDVREDYNVEHDVLHSKFGELIANSVEKLTKKFKGSSKEYEVYFSELSKCPISSIVKGTDRINNMSSMVGVFTSKKQLSYALEVEKYFLPMLKQARRNFPRQVDAYLNIETMLRQQVDMIKDINKTI